MGEHQSSGPDPWQDYFDRWSRLPEAQRNAEWAAMSPEQREALTAIQRRVLADNALAAEGAKRRFRLGLGVLAGCVALLVLAGVAFVAIAGMGILTTAREEGERLSPEATGAPEAMKADDRADAESASLLGRPRRDLYSMLFSLSFEQVSIEQLRECCIYTGYRGLELSSLVDDYAIYSIPGLEGKSQNKVAIVRVPGRYYGEGQRLAYESTYELVGSEEFVTVLGDRQMLPVLRELP
ncbi:MAG: hypothetical protein F9K16_02625 [Thermoanaerobaculia bacterium]|nr:MAG: hypothetical protein F9K16_02625 [Thermoanaerobaculia bacterium]MBZ0100746.1 hypothetical protein [Thermoanaerobaculia bacterium]